MHVDSLPLLAVGSASLMGRSHRANEDALCALDSSVPQVAALRRGALFAVADGVSTVPDGGWAAQITCERLQGFFDPDVAPSQRGLLQLVNEIDWELRGRGPGRAACTLSALWLADRTAHLVHVGDSDVFRVRHGEIEQLTEHHSSGRRLGAYMGMGPLLNKIVQVWRRPLYVGDIFILATDGATGEVTQDEMIGDLWTHRGDLQASAEAILARVDLKRGRDDATVVIVDVLKQETFVDA